MNTKSGSFFHSAPAGLVTAFKLLSESSDNSGAAAALAAEAYPYALELITAVNATGGDDVGAGMQ